MRYPQTAADFRGDKTPKFVAKFSVERANAVRQRGFFNFSRELSAQNRQ